MDALLESPGVEVGTCGDEWALLRSALLSHPLRGNMVTGAWIAATVQALSEHLVTLDRDFVALLPARDLTLLSHGE